MGMIPYDAVDLPRRDRVVVAHHGQLETCPYEVIWDGTSNRPLGRQLSLAEEKRSFPQSAPLISLRGSWRDLERGSTAHVIAFWLNEVGEAIVPEIVQALGYDASVVQMSLRRMRDQGYAEVAHLRPRAGNRPWNVWRVIE